MVKEFNVLIENNGKFEPYDVMKRLKYSWENFIEERNNMGLTNDSTDLGSYWTYPTTYEEIKKWVDQKLMYMFWSKCEYEIILSTWPPYELDEDTKKYKKGTVVIPNDKGKKIDIYEQCEMNLDTVVRIFIEDIYIPSQNKEANI